MGNTNSNIEWAKSFATFFLLKVFDSRNNRRFSFSFEKIQNLIVYKLYNSLVELFLPAQEKLENLDQNSHVIWTNLEVKTCHAQGKKFV